MRKLLWLLAALLLTTRLPAQSTSVVRLAIVVETDDAAPIEDELTAELSKNPQITLLERNEIDKVYREQGLSAANRDYLKLGQILGADGLWLFNVTKTATQTNLAARLIAVKPGVVLASENFPWPVANLPDWASAMSDHLKPFLPKLTVLVKDAIPISVVNLRSAIASAQAPETEQQLKLLTIQRLSQEPQFFVLERQRMNLMAEEKELKGADDSAFWSGSYLIEGVIDQNGYSPTTITINARLSPPKGAAPLEFQVSGSRTNLAEVVNQLAEKIDEMLKVHSTMKEWNATDEAAQFFAEATWALKWGLLSEAQAAADSAWALGKRDMDCLTAQIQAYEVPPDTGGYRHSEFTNPSGTNDVVRAAFENATPNRPLGLTWREQHYGRTPDFQYAFVTKFPEPESIETAIHALQLYYSFSRTLPSDQPQAGSPWYHLGIEVLTSASRVLQHFHFVPESQKASAEKLSELRVMTRSVADWISKSPSVHGSYFVGDQITTYDELTEVLTEQPNLFQCEVKWGCFWQEKPENCIKLYSDLMASPAFCYIHRGLWFRELERPRLIAWTETDRQAAPLVWQNFLQQLGASTNLICQLETQALIFADADNDTKLCDSFTNLFNSIFNNRDALVANKVEVFYLNWGCDELVSQKTGNGLASSVRESLNQLFYSQYRAKLDSIDREYRDKTVPAHKMEAAFVKQKQFLTNNTPYDFLKFVHTFMNTFRERTYSREQALEIRPLLAACKSNLVAQSQTMSGVQKARLMSAITQLGFLEDDVKRILSAPSPKPPALNQPNPNPQTPGIATVVHVPVPPALNRASEVVTNVLTVDKFLAIPLDTLTNNNISRVRITAHHLVEGRLLLDFQYDADIYSFDERGAWKATRSATLPAIALLDLASEHWDIIPCPEVGVQIENNFYHRSALLRGNLFTSDGGQIRKYDFQKRQWQVLPISNDRNCELFAVNGHLYGANGSIIFEIIDEGKATRILASARRQPPVSALDTEDFGTPTLFEGPGHSLRLCTKSNIFTWTGNDWREDFAVPPSSFPPAVSTDGVLFRGYGSYETASISSLATQSNVVEVLLRQKRRPGGDRLQESQPLWKLPPKLSLLKLPVARREADLFLFLDHIQEIANGQYGAVQQNVLPKDGYNASLLCFSRDLPFPERLYLKFDVPAGFPPITGLNPDSVQMLLGGPPPVWLLFSSDSLIFGLETSDRLLPNGAPYTGKGGIWLLPLAQIEPAIAAEKQIQLAQKADALAAVQKRKQLLLAKYDRNHNGVIDPDEKEEALDDPLFIESDLDTIAPNGYISGPDLTYFDANTNQILDPKEQAGIEIAQHLLAQRFMKELDASGKGFLDHVEFGELLSRLPDAGPAALFHDHGHVDPGELESYLMERTRMSIRPQFAPSSPPGVRADAAFKEAVEYYWYTVAHKSKRRSPTNPRPQTQTNATP